MPADPSNHHGLSAPTRRAAVRWRRVVQAVLLTALGLCSSARGADETRLQRAAALAGPRAEAMLPQWLGLLFGAWWLDVPAQLGAVNRFYNLRIEFATDAQAWGVVDHWASPLELLNKGRGDCEDYAIGKYFTLLALGVPRQQLRLVYVQARLDDGQLQAHMVLAYYPPDGSDALLLDNLVDEVVPSARRGDLRPLFSFNGEGLWQGVGTVSAGNPTRRLERWREVLARARAEGFP